ncbi:MAG: DNA-directed RNA polymerase subunit alpha [Zetaproteobacteria bacterium CG12_big_fil_rev_8_21_14_0_65_55_1124]|nr:MAG: DNA-directed RNA polymerase subunit alpha [Zetaproteobacteria bacterium CG1_02_55_237]PIS18360.1 MAG: DNA-directed RNA polymerase subunit alpha [Zetaproteobacteria bacterium CG08_land_8_20_14_0_20_55_17]PIW43322.1 MAG: DNA-directed RNA polymerase subunit alpha [Zetaproteobacteria bacterium CG12_big_fil_rev_8_21_14_0_65_55_1124]PIY52176.1 MAG: DNA-directed RNA polymerase subunit alpha [Zetaproteobacteria bacterium CG_4_10_14_0_8_um_filter_55_43]PIZ37726.1 MAG: DNA-directed RNA polymerase
MKLIKPRKVTVEDIVPGRTAKITFEPLERGYGTTFGNSLRRMLLSSLSGAAVTQVRIDGVSHEFDTIKGVREDVMDIMLTLKTVDLKSDDGERHVLKINAKGAGKVTARDLKGSGAVHVLNGDLILAHLNEDGVLNMEVTVESGFGYDPAQNREGDERPAGTLLVDASFSPIRRVATRVENARVGQDTNYDKLIMEVETNGALSPEEAIHQAASIIKDQLAVFVSFDAIEREEVEADTAVNLEDLLRQPIDHLDLSVRSMNCLKSDNIFYVGDLVMRSEQEMLRTPNFGRKSLTEIREVLDKMGLDLGMQIDNWPPQDLPAITE